MKTRVRIEARYRELRAWRKQASKLDGSVSSGPALYSEEIKFRCRVLEFEAREVNGKLIGQFNRDPSRPGRGRGWLLMREGWK